MMRLTLLAALFFAATSSLVVSASHSIVAPVALHVSFIKDVVRPIHQKNRKLQDMGMICSQMGGTMTDTNSCEMCPGSEAEGCCVIDLETFDFACDVCENINGVQECAQVTCGLTDSGGYGCNGCGDYSTGEACFDFECTGDDEADCTCNGITWNGQDCGTCTIDSNGNPDFDCGAVGGPNSSTSPASTVQHAGGAAALLVIAGFAALANLI